MNDLLLYSVVAGCYERVGNVAGCYAVAVVNKIKHFTKAWQLHVFSVNIIMFFFLRRDFSMSVM